MALGMDYKKKLSIRVREPQGNHEKAVCAEIIVDPSAMIEAGDTTWNQAMGLSREYTEALHKHLVLPDDLVCSEPHHVTVTVRDKFHEAEHRFSQLLVSGRDSRRVAILGEEDWAELRKAIKSAHTKACKELDGPRTAPHENGHAGRLSGWPGAAAKRGWPPAGR